MRAARVRRAALWMLVSCGVGLATLAALDWALRLTPWHADFGVTHLPALSGYYRPDPALGFDIQEDFPTTRVAVRGDGVIYTIWSNALGCFDRPYRGEPGYVLLLGDSFSHAYAPFDAKWGTRLESLLGRRVLKCGVTGFGTRQEVGKARRVVGRAGGAPALIVVGWFANDLYDDWVFPGATVFHGTLVGMAGVWDDDPEGTVERADPAKLEERERRWRYACVRDEPPRRPLTQPLTCWLTRHSLLYNLLVTFGRRRLAPSPPAAGAAASPESGEDVVAGRRPVDAVVLPFEPIESRRWLAAAWERHRQQLTALRTLAGEQGARLVIALIPAREQVYPFFRARRGLSPRLDYDQPARMIAGALGGDRAAVVDLAPLFRRHADPSPDKRGFEAGDLYWRVDNHLSERGERLVALGVARHVLAHRLLEVGDAAGALAAVDASIDRLGRGER